MAAKIVKNVTRSEKYPMLFFDIETVGNDKAIAMIDDPKAPGNLRDPEKIAAAIEAKRAELIEFAPLDSDLGKIACIGYAVGRDGAVIANVVNKRNNEKKVLEDFWVQFASTNGRCSGYNVLTFDLPFIMKRSFDLGVKPSIIPNLAKYRTEPVTDLAQLFSGWDYRNMRKLKWLCKRYGIEILDEGVDGSMVKDLSEKELAAYSISDVTATRDLYYRMQGYYFL